MVTKTKLSLLGDSKSLILGLLGFTVAMFYGHDILGNSTLVLSAFIGLFVLIIYSAMSVVHMAEALVPIVGKKIGALILTLAAIAVEILLVYKMYQHGASPELLKDTVFYAVIFDVVGIIGIAGFAGALKHKVLDFNQNSSNSYVVIIIISIFIALGLPNLITVESDLVTYSTFMAIVLTIITVAFYYFQVVHSPEFFIHEDIVNEDNDDNSFQLKKFFYYFFFLFANIILIGYLSEELDLFMVPVFENYGVPLTFKSIIIAMISASPEIMVAVIVARNRDFQTAINIALGASVATATLPIMFFVLFTTFTIDLVASSAQLAIFAVVLALTQFKLSDGKFNLFESVAYLCLLPVIGMLAFLGYL